jgi:tetrapyrrole methylase family protein/MazG family protein
MKIDKDKYAFDDLIEIMSVLRSPNGCPWDLKQDHDTLKQYLIEESHEVLEAIDLKSDSKLCEELGDVLLQVVFHSQIAKDDGRIYINEVIDGICKKMISRHTHVFGSDIAKTADDVIETWEKNKKQEKKIDTYTEALNSIPKNLPALMRSLKTQEKAAKVGFDWDNVDDAFKKIEEESKEVQDAYKNGTQTDVENEIGDLLFSVVNVARFLKVHPELALGKTIDKFIKRFEYIEKTALSKGLKLENMTLQDMDDLWNASKQYIF